MQRGGFAPGIADYTSCGPTGAAGGYTRPAVFAEGGAAAVSSTAGNSLGLRANASSISAFKAALRRGDIFLHAFPHDGEASYYPDSAHAFPNSFS